MTSHRVIFVAALLVLAMPAHVGAAAPAIPNGVYRTTITDADLRAGHATSGIAENHGTFTLTIRNGGWSLRQRAPNALHNSSTSGVYRASGATVVFTTRAPAALAGLTFAVEARPLRAAVGFTVVRAPVPEIRVIFGAHPWRRVS